MTPAAASAFEAQRPHLQGLAYRMLGSHAEAEDIVQEAWLRWREADHDAVNHPGAFLRRAVTNLSLDRLKSAQVRREQYVGPWLPEPVLDAPAPSGDDPAAMSELADDISYAFMLALERLSPLERAAFLLHDVFDADFEEVAEALGRTPATCRQLASRARNRVREARPRYRVPRESGQQLADAFLQALGSGDIEQLKAMLAEDARFVSDGGGRVVAAGIPVHGRDRVARVLHGLARKYPQPAGARFAIGSVNGLPGFLVHHGDGTPIQTVALEADDDGRITGIYVVRNPDKLRHLNP
jgi:RNA polymerase sigma-70 factor (ECF subfamily)